MENPEKKHLSIFGWIFIGFVLAFAGVIFSDFVGSIFNGLSNGMGMILGMGAYLCIVVITCTGIIVTKLDNRSDGDGTKPE